MTNDCSRLVFGKLLPFPFVSRPLHCSSSGEQPAEQLTLCSASVPVVPRGMSSLAGVRPGCTTPFTEGPPWWDGGFEVEFQWIYCISCWAMMFFKESGCSVVAGTCSQIINACHWLVKLLWILLLPGIMGNLGFFLVFCKDCLEGEVSRGFCAHTACSGGLLLGQWIFALLLEPSIFVQ